MGFNPGNALRWNGTAWNLQQPPTWVVRRNLSGLSWVPGTRSLWATGNMINGPSGNQIYGTILKGGA